MYSEWISVNDRLPEIGQFVLCYRPLAKETNDPIYDVRVFDGNERTSPQGIKHCFDMWCHPSHWMPLPAPPNS
jgi:hypothetical protein